MTEISWETYLKALPIVVILAIVNISCNFHRSKSIDEAKSDSFNYRAKFFLETKQYDSAWYAINQSLVWDSKNWGAYNNRAILKGRTGSPENDVVADFEKALHLKPDYEISLYSLANYYEDIKAYEKAVKACNEYFLVSMKNDFDSIEPIRRLQQRCEKRIAESQKIIDGISVRRAKLFYDSIHTAIDESLPIEQRFLDNLGKAMQSVLKDRDASSIDIVALRAGLDSSKNVNAEKINEIIRVTEIDNTINYKQIVLDYVLSFDRAFKALFKSYVDDLSTKDVSIIKESSMRLQTPLREIKQKESLFKQAQMSFQKKYELYEGDD